MWALATEARRRSNHRRGVNAGGVPWRRVKQLDGAGEIKIRVCRAQRRQRWQAGAALDDGHRERSTWPRRGVVRTAGAVARIREEGQLVPGRRRSMPATPPISRPASLFELAGESPWQSHRALMRSSPSRALVTSGKTRASAASCNSLYTLHSRRARALAGSSPPAGRRGTRISVEPCWAGL